MAQSHPDSYQHCPITVPSWLAAVNPQLYSATTSNMSMDGCTVTVPKVTRLPAAAASVHPLICNLSDLVQVHIAHNPAVLHRSLPRGANCASSESIVSPEEAGGLDANMQTQAACSRAYQHNRVQVLQLWQWPGKFASSHEFITWSESALGF